ncbi:hypothetical protein JTE90_016287 [Oedothorax gibbosus]|uniref:Uncharacterized protein n=1 Tax=Oedothorax gibbosus TaxID=931172 RepID=A0AAV6U4Y7_9ARAC|nr:hypothetical protein JTE90_016287 [Oedothorax gibbosus]
MDPGIQYLLEACIKLRCSMSTQIRAMILYHHFMASVEGFNYDKAMIAAVSLNLSSQIGEEEIDHDTLILLFYCIVNKTEEVLDSDDASFKLMKKTFVTNDFIVARILEYSLNHQLAHQYLLPFLELIFARSSAIAAQHRAMSQACLSLMNDFYTSRKCLLYKAEHITVACIDCALEMYELEKCTEIIHPWYEGLCSDLDEEKLKEIKHDILLLYQKTSEQAEPSPLSPKAVPESLPNIALMSLSNAAPETRTIPTAEAIAEAEADFDVFIEQEKDIILEEIYQKEPEPIEEIVISD